MKYVVSPIPESGIPLGGIGTGSFEIRADGKFYEWQIFNNKPWRCGGAPWEDGKEDYMDPNGLFFAVRLKPKDGEPLIRLLRFGYVDVELGYDLYTLPWVKGVESIEYLGEYPLAKLRFIDSLLMVNVELEAFSPFIPGDVKNSSIPTAIFAFRIQNTTDKTVEVSLLSCLKNPIGKPVKNRKYIQRIIKRADRTSIFMAAEGVPEKDPTYRGSMVLTVLDPEASFEPCLLAKAQSFKRMWVDFRSDGHLDSKTLEAFSLEDVYGLLCSKTVLKPGEARDIVFILSWFFPNHIDTRGNLIGHMYENWFKDALEVDTYVVENLKTLKEMTECFHKTLYDTSLDYWVVDAVSAQLTTMVKSSFYTKDGTFAIWEGGPGCCGLETLDVTFYGSIPIALIFPELEKVQLKLTAKFQLNPENPRYEEYVLGFPENRMLFAKKALENPRILSEPSTLRKALLEVVRETGLDPKGRIPHLFPGTFKDVDAYHMVDLMPKYALLVYRDYLWTGDENNLRELWESVKEALDNVLRTMDPANKKLPYHYAPSGFEFMRGVLSIPMGFQTYDVWSFLGYSTYVCGIWLSALKAVQRIATVLEDENYASEIKAIYEEALKNFEDMLWNGEYFNLWSDPLSGLKDEGCMTDQLCGQWYANLTELSPICERSKILSALKAILKYNVKYDEGLINGSYPAVGKRPALNGDMAYPNEVGMPWAIGSQPDTPWTGTEYAFASLLIQEGLINEGLAIAKNVYDRYAKAGLTWNHLECGGHYYRAMDVWALLTALEGFSYNAVEKRIKFAPKVSKDSFKAIFAANGAWGTFVQKRFSNSQQNVVKLNYGKLSLKSIVLESPLKFEAGAIKLEVLITGKTVEAYFKPGENNLVEIIFRETIVITPEKPILVTFSF
ncbi:MAG: GH116 family glycosyl hydrolase [Candidatus Bathyarchaeia archaeon]